MSLDGRGFFCHTFIYVDSLHWAANSGHLETLLVLLRHGADRNSTTEADQKPIDLAKKEIIINALKATNVELFEWLVKHDLATCAGPLGEEEVTLDILPSLVEDELKDMGIKLGLRKKLLQAAEELKGHPI